MDRLPRELIDAILQQCVTQGHKPAVLELRLVCKVFDQFLKPLICRTLHLDISRLSKNSGVDHPDMDGLRTIGSHCKGLYIDLMAVRDEGELFGDWHTMVYLILVAELEYIENVRPSRTSGCDVLRKYYCMSDDSFTEVEFFATVNKMLLACCYVDHLRLNLPQQFVGEAGRTATMILANAFKAFATRDDEVSAKLKTLVLERVTDTAICSLWMNPIDVMNIMKTFEVLEHLVISLVRNETAPDRVRLFGNCLWSWISNAVDLKSLCLIGLDQDTPPPKGFKQTRHWEMSLGEFRGRSLPAPYLILANLTCLELKAVEVSAQFCNQIGENIGLPLEELYLNEVLLKTEISPHWNADTQNILWTGVPGERPGKDANWIAMAIRCAAPRLRICRASLLAYDVYSWQGANDDYKFDLVDPCGLARGISQRFVEIVMGFRQPNTPNNEPVVYLPRDSIHDSLLLNLTDRSKALSVTEYDAYAYQIAVANTTSKWHRSLDGVFNNCNAMYCDVIQYIGKLAFETMDEISRLRRARWGPGE